MNPYDRIKRGERWQRKVEKIAIWIIVAFVAFSVWKGLEGSANQNRCVARANQLPSDQVFPALLKCH